MREIYTEINISAPPLKVWDTLMNLSDWPNWNPIVHKIIGNLSVGGKLFITMKDKEGKAGRIYTPIVTALDKEKRFSFIGTMMAKPIFSVERIIELKDSKEGTLLSQKETYSGFMAPLLWNKLRKFAIPMLNSMNRALKSKVEL